MTYREAYQAGRERLISAGIGEAELDARLLLEYVCGTDRNHLIVYGSEPVGEEELQRYQTLLAQRADRIPLQYLTGVQNFMGLDFLVNEHVLIPRQDTEILVEEALRHLHDGMHILDLCTGSGCILISLLRYSNDCRGLGADISPEALTVAEENAKRLVPEEEIEFIKSDLYERVEGMFDVIVSNPPYIPTGVIESLMPEVREHEPRLALDGCEDGLIFYRRIINESRAHLKGGGMLFFEIGFDQGAAVRELMEQAGFLEVKVSKDYAGLDRVVSGILSLGPIAR